MTLADGSAARLRPPVVATGATTGFFGVAGAAEHSLPALHAGRRPPPAQRRARLASRRPTPTPRTSTAARRPSWWWAAAPPAWRSAGALVELLDVSRPPATACASTPNAPGSSSSKRATGCCRASADSAGRYAADDAALARASTSGSDEPVAGGDREGVRLGSGEWIDAAAVVWAGGRHRRRHPGGLAPGRRTAGAGG